jgi:hypothetical protein
LLLNSPQTIENTGFVAGELSLIVSLVLYHMSPRASVMTCARISVLHYVVPPVFTNSDKGKYKGAGHPVDICSVPTEAAADTKKII